MSKKKHVYIPLDKKYAVYSTEKKKLVMLFSTMTLAAKYLIGTAKKDSTTVSYCARNRGCIRATTNIFKERLAVRYANEEQEIMLGDNSYLILDKKYERPDFREGGLELPYNNAWKTRAEESEKASKENRDKVRAQILAVDRWDTYTPREMATKLTASETVCKSVMRQLRKTEIQKEEQEEEAFATLKETNAVIYWLSKLAYRRGKEQTKKFLLELLEKL